MNRWACVEIADFALQALRRARPQWSAQPFALLDRDSANACIEACDARAAAFGIRPGMRHVAALTLCDRLQAAATSALERETEARAVLELLRGFTPRIEPKSDSPGVFWLDASGLRLLHPSLEAWAASVVAALAEHGWRAAVAVGWRRFSTFAIARALARGEAGSGVLVLDVVEHEQKLARRVPLERLDFDPEVLAALQELGLRRLDDFLALDAEGIGVRFGERARALHEEARGAIALPLQARGAPVVHGFEIDFESPVGDRECLFEELALRAQPMLAHLERSCLLVRACELHLELERKDEVRAKIALTRPTREWPKIRALLALELERLRWSGCVERVVARFQALAERGEDARFFEREQRRSPKELARALETLRAAFGEPAVVRATLIDKHLPEASFAWSPCESLPPPKPRLDRPSKPVRRIHTPARALLPRAKREPDGWMPCGVALGAARALHGPYPLDGGWWRQDVLREYFFAELESGALVWLYHDVLARRWCLHGELT